LAQYSQWLGESGTPVFPGSQGTVWVDYVKGSVVRLPTHATNVPTQSELRNIFSHNYFAAGYIIEPDAHHPANRWLYLADRTYDFKELSGSTRSDTRRAQRHLRFADLSWDEIRQHGEAAFCQTNARHDEPATTHEAFLHYVDTFSRNPAHHAVGAWLEDSLAAFFTIALVDDWAEMKSLFVTDLSRTYHPSEGLYHYAFDRYVIHEAFQFVSGGLGGGLREGQGLHPFKVKVGFKAIPVHNMIATPRWVHPLLNPMTLFAAKAALRLNPRNRRLRAVVRILGDLVQPRALSTD
jgi:hypothetical protein